MPVDLPYPGPPRRPPAPRRRRPPRRLAVALLPALLGAGAALAVVAATGNLGGGSDGVTTVVREVLAPAPAAERAAPLPAPVTAPAPRAAAGSVPAIVRAASPAVVLVAASEDGRRQFGTGFIVDRRGRILTNAHVVGGAKEVQVTFQDRSQATSRVLGVDESTDLAVLRTSLPASARPLPLGRSAGLRVGDPVLAIGNPFGLERTATTGIVSGLKREINAPNDFPIQNAIQTDAAINQGNSGGPLLDAAGRVIGINSQILSEGGGSDGVGFAVPIDTVRPVADAIIRTGRPQHSWLGITGRDLTPEMAQALRLPGRTGVALVGIDRRGPAARARLRPARDAHAAVPRGGDVIVAVDGRAVDGMADVSQAVSSRPVGDRVTLGLLRDGRRVNVRLTLADRPDDVGRVRP